MQRKRMPDRSALVTSVQGELTTLTRRGTARARNSHPALSVVDQSLLGFIESNQGCRAIDIADHFHLNRSTVSRQLRSLADARLISMAPDPGSTRGQPIVLTQRGVEVQAEAAAEVLDALTGRLVGWTDEEVAAFADILRRYNAEPAA
ncbi:MarR family winged helix-turn-helix transcriptional regulator [Subtercola sp. YIM 133946]|uniref:MarR family winged helix-turn-helix transcriptional regulator n=1 Tax=Subtercola sp. YIM 133946 TaxID=3118909 RepID=UPI002F92F750